MSGYKPTRRDKIVVIIANTVLRLASKKYRDLLHQVIVDGLSIPMERRTQHDGSTNQNDPRGHVS